MTRASLCLGGPLNAKRPPASVVNGQQVFLHRTSAAVEPAADNPDPAPIVTTHRYSLVTLDVDKSLYAVYVSDGHDRANLVADVKRIARLV